MFSCSFRGVLIGLVLASVLIQAGCAATEGRQAGRRDGVFIHIKSGPAEAHSVLMGLRMAQIMSTDHDVLVYFDVDGIQNVLQGSPDVAMEPFGSSAAMIADLISRKVPVQACPGCLQALGRKPDQLMPGIAIADKRAFFSFTQGRILTLDY